MSDHLPQSWIEVLFGEEFELYSVPSFPTRQPEMVNGKDVGSTKQVLQPDDVLVCKINPRINRVWQVGPNKNRRQIGSSEWIGFRVPYLDPRYFRHYFSSKEFRDLICADVTGVGGSLTRAQPKKVASFPVPVAPIPEQKRIADKLDAVLARVDACRDRLDRIPAILKRFRQSVLSAATSGALTAEWREENAYSIESWVNTSLGDLVVTSANGLSKRRGEQGIETTVLRLADFRNSARVHGNERSIKLDKKEIEKYKLINGDLLVVRVNGSADLAGKFIKYEQQNEDLEAYCDHFIRLRLDSTQITPEFALFTANSGIGRSYLESVLVTSAGQNTINQASLFGLSISLPSIPEQTEIVRRVESLFAYADRLEARYNAARAQVEKLTPALLAKAFRGELVPQDPNEEPASELLARIEASKATDTPKKNRKPTSRKTIRAPKENSAMTKSRQDDDVKNQAYLAGHLKLLGGSAAVEALFKVSELPVADFYKQLAWEVEKGFVKDSKTVLEAADAA
jgi:type I restriction enzyme S subunit